MSEAGSPRFERVLLTGAAGRIGTALRPGLRTREGLRELRLSDIEPLAVEHPIETVAPADLGDADAILKAAQGIDAIVHLDGIPGEADLATLTGPNLHGVFHALDAARRAGVRRVVLASSNHVTGFEPAGRRLAGHEPPRPDSLYGATKVFGEALGRLYSDKFGLEVICLRIGTFAERPHERRHLSTWLSPADGVRLVVACLSAPSPLAFRVVYGASANTRGWWDLGPARELGYAPHDDAEAFAHELAQASEEPPGGPQGGEFAEPCYGGWAAPRDDTARHHPS
jgi:uronate dehydrogenase